MCLTVAVCRGPGLAVLGAADSFRYAKKILCGKCCTTVWSMSRLAFVECLLFEFKSWWPGAEGTSHGGPPRWSMPPLVFFDLTQNVKCHDSFVKPYGVLNRFEFRSLLCLDTGFVTQIPGFPVYSFVKCAFVKRSIKCILRVTSYFCYFHLLTTRSPQHGHERPSTGTSGALDHRVLQHFLRRLRICHRLVSGTSRKSL